jgi:putative ABC transport system permease protein
VKITDMADYITQTLGGLIDQLSLAAMLGFILAAGVAALITAMFFRMLIAKDAHQIAIMRSLGLSFKDVQLQYITRAIIVLLIGIIAGSIAAVTLGQGLVGILMPGISSMRFIINPVMSFIVCPLTLAAVVGVTVCIGSSSIKNISIMLAAE